MRKHMVMQATARHCKYSIQFVYFCNTRTHARTHATQATCYYKRKTEDKGRTSQQTRQEEHFRSQVQKNVLYLICQQTVSIRKDYIV
jgi:phosphoribosyl-AMP cyclohydrolase